MAHYTLAIDQGTTGTTCVLMNESFQMIASSDMDYPQIFPKPSWVEHDLNVIWETVKQTVSDAISKSKINPKDIALIGITNQRETTCAFDKKGKPLHHAIVWQDRRTMEWCKKNSSAYGSLKTKTGLPLDAYFSASKMKWMLENVPEVKEAASKKNLCLSTIDTFLLFKLTSGESFSTEPTNASRTLLMNLKTTHWDQDLLDFFHIDQSILPTIQNTFGHFGKTKNISFLPDGIPITCLIGDQQSALFGQGCISPGDIKCTYGTGAFLLQQTGTDIVYSNHGLLTTCSFKFNNTVHYALEGSVYIAGAAVQWLRDNLKFFPESSEIENLALQVENLEEMKYIMFLPFFSGIGTPHWISDAKASIVGLTRDTNNAHIARACLEGIALSINDCISTFKKDFKKVGAIKVDGGATNNNLLMQIQSDFSSQNILRPKNKESTSMGAALGAMVGLNLVTIDEVHKSFKLDKEFIPNQTQNTYSESRKSYWDYWLKRLYL